MKFEVEFTAEFEAWWDELSVRDQRAVTAIVNHLERRGPVLRKEYSSSVRSSRHGRMRELRVQSGGRPIRIFYALDPRRTVILLIGGDKKGQDRFYDEYVRRADAIYDQYLVELRSEGLLAPD